MRPSTAPNTAIPIPPPGGPFPLEQVQHIAGIRTEIDNENAGLLNNWVLACSNWLVDAGHDRELGITIRPKPVQPMAQTVYVAADTDKDNAVIWLWLDNTVPIGAPCPDLPALPVPHPNGFVHITRHIVGDWYAASNDDAYPCDAYPVALAPPVNAVSDDGVKGVFVKYASPVGNGWYIKVG